MNNIKKIIAIHTIMLIAVIFLGNTNAYASEVTGTLSSSAANSSGSQAGGTVGGNVGSSSTVSGTLSGGSGGSTLSGTVSGGGGGGGGGISGSAFGSGGGGSSTGGGQTNTNIGLAFGNSPASDVPGLPNTGIESSDPATILVNSIILFLGVLGTLIVYGIFTPKHGKTS